MVLVVTVNPSKRALTRRDEGVTLLSVDTLFMRE